MPKEAQNILDPAAIDDSMTILYNRMDDLLRDPSNWAELLSYRATPSNEESGPHNSRALSLLQGSIQNDLQGLREKKVRYPAIKLRR